MARGIKSFADDVLGIDPGGGGIVGSVKNIADDVLGIDPSGQGLVGSIRDNPRTAALLGSLGIGSLLYGGLGGLGSAVTGGLRSAGSALGSGLGALGGLLGGVAPYAVGYGLGRQQGPQIPPEGFYNMPGMGGGLLSGGAPIGQSAFDYARSIAGGMPFEQVVQPGMEFSLEQPMGQPIIDRTIPPSPGLPAVPPPVFRPLPVEPVAPVAPVAPQPVSPFPIDLDRLRGFLGLFDGIPAPEPQPEPVAPVVPEGPIYTQPGGTEPIGPSKGLPEFTPRSDKEIIDLIEGRLGEYQPVIPQPDLGGFARLEDIPSFVPRTDEEIRGLISEGIAGIPTPAQFDPSGLLGRIGGLERQISEIPQPDLGGITERIGALESREIPQFDPSDLLARISALETRPEPIYTQPGTDQPLPAVRSPLPKLSLFG